MSNLNEILDAPIPRSVVSQRQGGGGRSLSYLSSHYVIDRLNKVFGNLGWASTTTKLDCVHVNTVENTVHYIAQVRLVVEGEDGKRTEHLGTGYGDGKDKTNIGKAYELAVKEAESDALKRAAKNLGMSMGLALYSKDQENVIEDDVSKSEQKAPTATQAIQDRKDSINRAVSSLAKPAEKAPVSNDKALVMSEINSYAKIVAAKGKATIAQLKEDMRVKYGTDVKEELNEGQALELRDGLKQLASA